MIQGQAGQILSAQMCDTSGNAFTGAVTVLIDGDHTGQVPGQVGAGACNARGNGLYDYIVSAGDCGWKHMAVTFEGTGAVSVGQSIDTITPAFIQALQTATGLSSVVVNQLLLDAFIEIRQGRAGDALEPELLDWALGKLNRLFDRWNADPSAKYAVGFSSFTPTPNLAPHTLGPNAATWTVAARPDRIKGANLILNTVTPAVRIPIEIQDQTWWRRQTVQALATSIVTDLYYSPDWPNGTVNLWPVPTSTYPIELEIDTLFGNVQQTDVVWLPFGYRDAVTKTLAEELAPGCGQMVSPDLRMSAMDARVVVFGNNVQTRNQRTSDGGMPGGRRGGRYLYRTGRNR